MNDEIISVIPTIDSMHNSFTKSEKLIAKIIKEDPSAIIYSAISELSEKANVGDTTVVRFCRKLGFTGYYDFKIRLTQELSQANDKPNQLTETIDMDDDIEILMQKLLHRNHKSLEETIALLNPKSISKAVDYIENCNNLCFYGLGFSGFMALEAKLKFMRVGVRSDAFSDGHMMAMNAITLKENDVAVGISYSGSSKDLVDSIEIAHKNGAKTICLTHFKNSPITKHCDTVLLSGSRENTLQSGALSTRAAQLFTIDLLYTEFFRRNHRKASAIRVDTVKAISDKMY